MMSLFFLYNNDYVCCNNNFVIDLLQIQIIKMLLLFNVALLGFIVTSTYFLAKGHRRVEAVGWICAAFSVSVFAAPLSIMVFTTLVIF